ncbi:MAG TPA: hypothetical protein DIT64_12890 [Verrucomicrobiales bacterium]|nr:hypothetical protein [Verrucomicrobiales bacterium]
MGSARAVRAARAFHAGAALPQFTSHRLQPVGDPPADKGGDVAAKAWAAALSARAMLRLALAVSLGGRAIRPAGLISARAGFRALLPVVLRWRTIGAAGVFIPVALTLVRPRSIRARSVRSGAVRAFAARSWGAFRRRAAFGPAGALLVFAALALGALVALAGFAFGLLGAFAGFGWRGVAPGIFRRTRRRVVLRGEGLAGEGQRQQEGGGAEGSGVHGWVVRLRTRVRSRA